MFFTLKNLSYMSLHAISVFDNVLKWSPEKIAPQKHRYVLQKSDNMQVTRNTILISPHRLLC